MASTNSSRTGIVLPSRFLRAKLSADINIGSAASGPNVIVWSAGDMSVSNGRQIVVPAGYTKAKARASLTVTNNNNPGGFSFKIMTGVADDGTGGTAQGETQAWQASGGFGGGNYQAFTSEFAVVPGDYVAVRINWNVANSLVLKAVPNSFLEVELYN